MFQIIKHGTKIDFVKMFPYTSTISLLLVAASLILTFTHMKYGVDFSGGTEMQVKFGKSINMADLRKTIEATGIASVSVQSIGEPSDNEVLLRLPGNESNLNKVTEQIQTALTTKFAEQGVTIQKVDIVGPKAGSQLRLSGFLAMAWALIAIMVYVGLRFEFKFAPGAILSLIHDVTLICGVYAVFGIEFTLQTVAALLTIIGYSINDTVIVFDRIREHEALYPNVGFADHINNATNDTLSRTLLTSAFTLSSSLVMLFFGGASIHDFFLAVTIGIIVGSYSSIYVAAHITLVCDKLMKKKHPTEILSMAK